MFIQLRILHDGIYDRPAENRPGWSISIASPCRATCCDVLRHVVSHLIAGWRRLRKAERQQALRIAIEGSNIACQRPPCAPERRAVPARTSVVQTVVGRDFKSACQGLFWRWFISASWCIVNNDIPGITVNRQNRRSTSSQKNILAHQPIALTCRDTTRLRGSKDPGSDIFRIALRTVYH